MIQIQNYIIYGLVDPRTNKVFYIGSTTKSLWLRRAAHMKDVYHGSTLPAHLHIRENKINPKIRQIELLTNATKFYALKSELIWIEMFVMAGHDLKNKNRPYRKSMDNPSRKTLIKEGLVNDPNNTVNEEWLTAQQYNKKMGTTHQGLAMMRKMGKVECKVGVKGGWLYKSFSESAKVEQPKVEQKTIF